jgi:hypothetical protein
MLPQGGSFANALPQKEVFRLLSHPRSAFSKYIFSVQLTFQKVAREIIFMSSSSVLIAMSI